MIIHSLKKKIIISFLKIKYTLILSYIIYIYENVSKSVYVKAKNIHTLTSHMIHNDIHTLATNSQYEKIYQQIEIPIHYLK